MDILFVALLATYIALLPTKINDMLKGMILGVSLLIKLTFILLPLFIYRSGLLKTRQIAGVIVVIAYWLCHF